MGDTIFPKIMDCSKTKETWDILQEEFQDSAKVKTIKFQIFRTEFESIKMKDSESLKDYYSKIMELLNQLKIYGETITDNRVVEETLISLSEKYEPIMTVIEESKRYLYCEYSRVVGLFELTWAKIVMAFWKTIESAFQSKLNMARKSFDKRSSNEGQNEDESSKASRKEEEVNFQEAEEEIIL